MTTVADAILSAAARWRTEPERDVLANYADEQHPHPELSWSAAAGMNEQMEEDER